MVLLCAILLCISALFVCTSFNIRRQVRQTVEETNANALKFWSSNTENRLSMLYEHVYELLVSLYNNTELRSGTPLMDINTKRLIIDLMNDKMMVSADADALFVLDTDNDFYLYSSSTSLSAKERIALKQKMPGGCPNQPAGAGRPQMEHAERGWGELFFQEFPPGKVHRGCRVPDGAVFSGGHGHDSGPGTGICVGTFRRDPQLAGAEGLAEAAGPMHGSSACL